MSLQEYVFKYGKGVVRFNLDSAWVTSELSIQDYPLVKNPPLALREAIRNPIQSKPLTEIVKPGQKVAFLVNDSTRVANSHVFMPILLDELNSVGVSDRDMFIIFAVGAHRQLDAPEMTSLVGPDTARRVKMFNSDAKDPAQFQYVGTTSRGNDIRFHKRVVEADHIVCTGSIVYHFFAGFGGAQGLATGSGSLRYHLPQSCLDAGAGGPDGKTQREPRL